MDENGPVKTVSFKDLIDKKDVSITGRGTYLIGLSAEGDVAIELTEDDLYMVLLTLTLHENGGCTLAPANTDLPCYINASEEALSGETHLIDGTKLEVADKKLIFIDGPIPKRRRKLPPTPGISVGEPPPKPTRGSNSTLTNDTKPEEADDNKPSQGKELPQMDQNGDDDADSEKKWLETSWCMLDLADEEQNMFRDLKTPEQISILAASYFAKQLRMFTDATVTAQLLDDIFKLFAETVDHSKDIFLNYLSDISHALAKVPDKSNTRPMHAPAVRFLTELLKQCTDPIEKVILILDLLRTFSHFDNNLGTMIRYQTAAAVLGSMTAYLDVIEVQQLSVDILAKLATYKPSLEKKAPLREVGLDMVLRSVKYHNTDLCLSRSTCRVLANISSTLINVLNHWLDTESSSDSRVCSAVEQYEMLLEHLFKEGIPVIQAIMKSFGSDLGVNTEGRKFIFYYAKLQQLQLKRARWLKAKIGAVCSVETVTGETRNDVTEKDENDVNEEDEDDVTEVKTSTNEHLVGEMREEKPQSILKKVGSFENLRTMEKRLIFADDTVGGSDSDVTYSSASENELGESVATGVTQRVDVDDDFSSNVVHHLVRKTIKRRNQASTDADFEADISDSESESEFLRSLTVRPKPDGADSCEHTVDETVVTTKDHSVNETISGEFIEIELSKSDMSEANLAGEKQEPVTESGYVVGEPAPEKKLFDVKESIDTSEINDIMNSESASRTQSENLNTTNGITILESNKSNDKGAEPDLSCKDLKQSAIVDVTFLGKLVRTQIIVYVGSLVFKGDDSSVLMVIDKPIRDLLKDAAAPPGLTEFAESQYGASLTLMDLEPAIVISVIDAVRYRSVTKDLVQSAVLSLTRTMTEKLQTATLKTTMVFLKTLFSDPHLKSILTEEEFVKEFRTCFQNATERMEKTHSVEELRKNLASLNVDT